MSGPTVRARIPVAVAANGQWGCSVSGGCGHDHAGGESPFIYAACGRLTDAEHRESMHLVYVEVDLPLPPPSIVVEGKVVQSSPEEVPHDGTRP